ncbi:MAG: FecR family protein [Novosphingobium sp.]|nr:FecR family protein [Novosphingobium sp.]
MALVKTSALLSRPRHIGLAIVTLAAVLLTLTLAVPLWSKPPSKVVGIASAIVKVVNIKRASLTRFTRAKLRQRVSLGDQVQTGTQSRLQLALLDRTKISVGANARLTIDKFIYDPNGGTVSVSATKGALRFMSGSAKATRSVRTPSATVGIRGTIFDTAIGALAVQIAQRERAIPQNTRHDPNTATLAVLRGPGPNRQGKAIPGAIDVNAGGQTVALNQPLLAAYVPYAGATPIGPFPISLPGLNLLNNFILPPPPARQFQQTSGEHPVLRRESTEPPPWAVGGAFPPPDGSGPGPGSGPGLGIPGAGTTGFPTFPGGGGIGTTPPPTRDPVGTTPPTTPPPNQPGGTTINRPVTTAPTTRTQATQPVGPNNPNNASTVPNQGP